MSGVITGAGLGLFGSSANVLGGAGVLGGSLQGRQGAGARVFVNAANGNLVLQSADEILSGRGADLGLTRSYNSQGTVDSASNGLGWSWEGGDSYVVFKSGALNATGSVITRVTGDGHATDYKFNGTAYVSTDGDGATDTLIHGTGAWTWTDGSTRLSEVYGESLDDKTLGRLQSRTDVTGNPVTFTRSAAGLLTGIIDTRSGQKFELIYSGTPARLSQVNTYELLVDTNGNIRQPPVVSTTPLKQVNYEYLPDGSGRLSKVSSYLKPGDPASKVFVTTYAYDGTSSRILRVTQNDGSTTSVGATVSFTYEQVPGIPAKFRVTSVIDSNGKQVFQYNADNTTNITISGEDGSNPQLWTYTYDSKQQLIKVESPAANGARLTATYIYETDAADGAGHEGNLKKVIDPRGNAVIYQYDANGNVLIERDTLGNTIRRTYDANNRLLVETRFTNPDAAGLDETTKGIGSASGALISRRVYDSSARLRFLISAEGRVTEYRYNLDGLLERTLHYAGGRYDVNTLAADAAPSEEQMTSWVGQAALDRKQIELTQFQYDFRGNLSRRTDFASTDASGAGVPGDPGDTVTDLVYDGYGNLLHSVVQHGANRNLGKQTTYVFDGLNREISRTDAAGTQTTTLYDDLLGTITVDVDSTTASHLRTIRAFDTRGHLVSLSQSDANLSDPARLTRYLYDGQGRLQLTLDAQGGRHFNFYDAAGRLSFVVDANGAVTGFTYNADGQVLAQTHYANRLKGIDATHDANSVTGIPAWIDDPTNPTKVNKLTLVLGTDLIVAPGQDRTAAFEYDNAGRLSKRTDAAGTATLTQYDGVSRVKQQATAERVTRSFYDHDGNLVGLIDPLGYLVEYKYDAANRLVETVHYATRSLLAANNSRPVWVGADVNNVIEQSAVGGKAFSYRIPLVDADGDAFDLTVVSKPGWVTVTKDSGGVTLSGTPPATTVLTTHEIRLTANDRRGTALSSADVTLRVKVDNSPPAWGALPDLAVANGKATGTLTLPTATDAQSAASTLAYSFAGLPAGISATFNAASNTLTLGGTPTLPGLYVVLATVRDPQGLSTQRTFTIQVTDAGAPQWPAVNVPSVARTGPFSLTLPAAVDPDGQSVTYAVLDKPSWLQFDPATFKFTGTPPAGTTVGPQMVTVVATDPQFARGVLSFPIMVTNAAPEWALPPTVRTLATLNYTPPAALDPEGSTITYSASNLPAGLSINSATGQITGTIQNAIEGQVYIIRLTASDNDPAGASSTSSDVWFIVDRSPVYNGGVPGSIGHRALPIRIPDSAFSDPDGDPVTIQASGLPSGVTFDGHWISGIPDTLGTWAISFTAVDPFGASSAPVPSWITRDVDPPPPPRDPPSPFPGPPGPRPPIQPFLIPPMTGAVAPLQSPPAPQLVSVNAAARAAAALPPPPLPITSITPFEDVLAAARPAVNEKDQHSFKLYDGVGRVVGDLDQRGFLTETVYNDVLNTRDGIQYMNPVTFVAGDTLTTLRNRALLAGGKKETTHTTFDDAGRVSTVTEVDGTTTHLMYDSAGRLVRKVHAEAQLEDDGTSAERGGRTVFNAFGEVIGTIGGVGDAWLASDPARKLTDALSRFGTRYEYNSVGQRTKAIDANGHITLFYYDREGQLRFTINARGEVVENQFNSFGQLSSVRAYDGRIASTGVNPPLTQLQAAGGGPISSLLSTQIGVIKDDVHDRITSYLYDQRGLTTQTTDAEGFVTSNAYTAYGELKTEQRTIVQAIGTGAPVTTTRRLDYDLDGRLVSMTRDLGGINANVQTTYDAFGRVLLTIDAQGRVSSSTEYKDNGRTIQVTDVLGRTVRTEFDAYARAVKVFDAVQMAISDASQRKPTTYEYDNTTRKLVVTTPEGVQVKTIKTRSGETLSVEDGRHDKKGYLYNRDGALLTATDALQHFATRNEYDDSGRLKSTRDARDVVTTYEYDEVNRLVTRKVDPTGLNLTTTYEFDAFGEQILVTEGAGTASAQVMKYEFDRDGRRFRVTADPQGLKLTTTFQFDGLDDIVQVSRGTTGSPDQLVTQYQFDKLGRRVKEIEAPSAVLGAGPSRARDLITEYHYDVNGPMTRRIDAAGNNTLYVYDDAGQLVQTIDALGAVIENSYDADGRLTRTIRYHNMVQVAPTDNTPRQVPGRTSADQVTYFVYDRDGHQRYTLRAYVSGAWIINQNFYDADGNVVETRVYDRVLGDERVNAIDTGGLGTISVASMTSELARLGYDESNAASLAAVRRTRFAYDAVNRLRFMVDPMGGVIENVYDATGNVLTTTMFASVPSLSVYDEQTINDSVIRANVANRVVGYAYDAAGNQKFAARLLAPAAGAVPAQWIVSEKVYDALNRVVQTIDYATVLKSAVNVNDAVAMGTARQPSGEDRISAVAYDHAGRIAYQAAAQVVTAARTGMKYAVTRLTRDAMDHVVQSTAFAQALSLADVTLGAFDGAVTAAVASDVRNRTTRFVLDAVGRVHFVVAADGGLSESLYDSLGRLAEKRQFDLRVNSDTPISETALMALRAGRAVGDGVTRGERYTYDAVGRKKTCTDALGFTEKYDYNATGDLEFRTDKKGQVWQYVYDLMGRVSDELSPSVTIQQSDGTMRTGVLRTHYGYDALGNLRRKIEATDTLDQRFTDYDYDLLGRQTKVTLPGVYDPNLHRVVVTSSASGAFVRTLETVYDTFGDALRTAVRTGAGVNDLQFEYKTFDNVGRVVHDVDAFNHVTKFTYTAFGEQQAVTRYSDQINIGKPTPASGLWSASDVDAKLTGDTLSRTVTTEYDNSGRKTLVTQPQVASYFYSRSGVFPVASGITAAQGSATVRYEYNNFGDLFHEVQAQSDTTSQETWHYYDLKGRETRTLQKVTDGTATVLPRAYDTERRYDALNNLVQVIEYAGTTSVDGTNSLTPPAIPVLNGSDRITGYTYDADDQRKSAVRYGLTYTDDLLRDVTKTREQGVVVSTLDYDALGHVSRVTDAFNNATVTEYDALGRVTKVTEPARLVKSATAVDPFAGGGQVSVSPVTTMTYGAFGQVVASTRSSGGVSPAITTRQAYDFAGNLISSTDAMGTVTSYEVDFAGRMTRATMHVHSVLAQRLPSSDLPPAITWRTVDHDIDRRFAYDLAGRLTDALDIFKDDAGNLIQSGLRKKFNSFGDVTDEQKVWGAATTALSALSVGTVTKYGYDSAGHLTTMQNAAGLTRYYYNLSGQMTRKEEQGNGNAADGTSTRVSEMVFDLLGRTQEMRQPTISTSEPGAAAFMSTPFTTLQLDRWGNILERDVSTFSLNTQRSSLIQTTFYTYNADNKVTSERHGAMNTMDEDGVVRFLDTRHETHYDLAGRDVKDLYIARDLLASTDSAPLRVHSRAYDAVGNLTSETTGLPTDTAFVETTQYAYDANNHRVGQLNNLGTVTVDDYDLNGNLVSHALLRSPNRTDPYVSGSGQSAVAVLLNSRRYDAANRVIEEDDYNTNFFGETVFIARFTAYDERSFARATFTLAERPRDGVPHGLTDGVETNCTYDILGNKVREEDAAHNVTTWQYDTTADSTTPGVPPSLLLGQLRRLNVGGHVTDYFYNDFGQVTLEKYSGTGISDPAAANQRAYAYNVNGLVASVTDITSIGSPGAIGGADFASTGSTTTYRYDNLGLVSKETLHSSGVYDVATPSGIVIKNLPRVDRSTTTIHDSLGRITSVQLDDLGAPSNPRSRGVVRYDYDALDNRVHVGSTFTGVHADPGAAVQIGPTFTKDVWTKFDSEGRIKLANRTVLNGALTDAGTIITYDLLGRRATARFEEGDKTLTVTTSVTLPATDRQNGQFGFAIYDKFSTYAWKQTRSEFYGYNDMGLLTTVRQAVIQNDKTLQVTFGPGRMVSTGNPATDQPTQPLQRLGTQGPTAAVLQSTRTYNLFGQVTKAEQYETITFTNGGIADFHANLASTTSSSYDTDGRLRSEVTNDNLHPENTNKHSTTYHFDAAGILRSSEFEFGPNNGIGGTPENYRDSYLYEYTFVAGGLKESRVTVTSTLPRAVPGVTISQYDARGNLLTQSLDNQADDKRERRLFSYDTQGHVVTKDVFFTNKNETQVLSAGGSQDFLYVDGHQVGTIGGGSLSSTTQFTSDFTPISQSYPSEHPTNHAVVTGDTLAGIAQSYLGDANLWYLIADANGVNAGPTQSLPPGEIGRIYRIPNVVDSLRSSAATFKPYDPSAIFGKSRPTSGLLPPPGESTCKQIAGAVSLAITMIVKEVGTVVLSAYVGPVLAGAIAGAASNALGQLTYIAMGGKPLGDFSGWDVLEASAEGAVGGFLGGVTKGITKGANFYLQVAAQGISAGTSAIANAGIHEFFNRVRNRDDEWNLTWEGLFEGMGQGSAGVLLGPVFDGLNGDRLKTGSAVQQFLTNSFKPSGWVWQDESRQWSSLINAALGAATDVTVAAVFPQQEQTFQNVQADRMPGIATESPYDDSATGSARFSVDDLPADPMPDWLAQADQEETEQLLAELAREQQVAEALERSAAADASSHTTLGGSTSVADSADAADAEDTILGHKRLVLNDEWTDADMGRTLRALRAKQLYVVGKGDTTTERVAANMGHDPKDGSALFLANGIDPLSAREGMVLENKYISPAVAAEANRQTYPREALAKQVRETRAEQARKDAEFQRELDYRNGTHNGRFESEADGVSYSSEAVAEGNRDARSAQVEEENRALAEANKVDAPHTWLEPRLLTKITNGIPTGLSQEAIDYLEPIFDLGPGADHPDEFDLRNISVRFGWTHDNSGVTVGNIVTLDEDDWNGASDRGKLELLGHEITHSLQYALLGKPQFFWRYLGEYNKGSNYRVPGDLEYPKTAYSEMNPIDKKYTLDQLAERTAHEVGRIWEGQRSSTPIQYFGEETSSHLTTVPSHSLLDRVTIPPPRFIQAFPPLTMHDYGLGSGLYLNYPGPR